MSTQLCLIACCHAVLHELRLGIVQFGCVFVPCSESSNDE